MGIVSWLIWGFLVDSGSFLIAVLTSTLLLALWQGYERRRL
jgi:hypothetical protein